MKVRPQSVRRGFGAMVFVVLLLVFGSAQYFVAVVMRSLGIVGIVAFVGLALAFVAVRGTLAGIDDRPRILPPGAPRRLIAGIALWIVTAVLVATHVSRSVCTSADGSPGPGPPS